MTTRTVDRSGFCVCGRPVAAHFTKRNQRLSCDDVARILAAAGDMADEKRTIWIGPGECLECRRGHHDRCSRDKGYDCECSCRPQVVRRLQLVKSDRRDIKGHEKC